MNMVLGDFIIGAFGCPVDFTAAYNRGWKVSALFCTWVGFCLTFTGKFNVFFKICNQIGHSLAITLYALLILIYAINNFALARGNWFSDFLVVVVQTIIAACGACGMRCSGNPFGKFKREGHNYVCKKSHDCNL